MSSIQKTLVTVLLLFSISAFAQVVDIPITVSDNGGSSSILKFGLDPTATDGIDIPLGEQPLPPLPPAGVFDARFNVTNNESTLRDYRNGTATYSGSKDYELQYQVGTGTTITINYNLPGGVKGVLQDVVLGTIINVPISGTGSYTVTNPGVFNKLKMTINYKLGAPPTPTLTSPANQSTNQAPNVTLNWQTSAEAMKFIVQVATDNAFGNLVLTDTLTGNSKQLSSLTQNTTYFWRVQMWNNEYGTQYSQWSNVWQFTTQTLATPVLTSPLNNAVNQLPNLVLNWNQVTYAVQYQVQVSKDSLFQSSMIVDETLTANSKQMSGLDPLAKYFWRVRAKNVGFSNPYSDWAAKWNFTTKVVPPVAPVLYSPANQSTNVKVKPQLKWFSSKYATSYNLIIATDNQFSNIILNTNTTDTLKALDLLNYGTTYYWKVIASNGEGPSPASTVWSFTTVAVTWVNKLNINDFGQGNGVLTFGTASPLIATNGIDEVLDEAVLPPLPPAGVFDVRFEIPSGGADFSLIDFRADTNQVINWVFKIQPSNGGYPVRVSWDSTLLPAGTFLLKDMVTGTIINVNMKNQGSYSIANSSITSLKIEYKKVICADINLVSGWNIASIPVLAENMTKTEIFPLATSPAYGYNNGYVNTATLVNGKGYWVRYPSTAAINICGSDVGLTTVPVAQGWNLIGVYNTAAVVANLTTTPAGILSSPFYGYNNAYQQPTQLLVGKGYWIRATQNGVININATLKKDAKSENIQASINPTWAKINIADISGKSFDLYLTSENENLYNYELPPTPPEGIFDVRFSSDRFVENLNSESKEILFNGVEFPITITSVGKAIRIKDNISGNILNSVITDGQSIIIDKAGLSGIKIESTEAPVEFALQNNYPNPFNPSTVISYQLPVDSKVSLKLYDVLGSEIAVLIDEVKEAGKHNYQLSINNYKLSSGVYFYSIEATPNDGSASFRQIKKMTLMK